MFTYWYDTNFKGMMLVISRTRTQKLGNCLTIMEDSNKSDTMSYEEAM